MVLFKARVRVLPVDGQFLQAHKATGRDSKVEEGRVHRRPLSSPLPRPFMLFQSSSPHSVEKGRNNGFSFASFPLLLTDNSCCDGQLCTWPQRRRHRRSFAAKGTERESQRDGTESEVEDTEDKFLSE